MIKIPISLDAFTLTPASPLNLPAVAQVGNLLYRRLVVGWLQSCRTAADCQSAKQQTVSLRYGLKAHGACNAPGIIPLREGEKGSPVVLHRGCLRLLSRIRNRSERRLLSPLPAGEGQGEGERLEQKATPKIV